MVTVGVFWFAVGVLVGLALGMPAVRAGRDLTAMQFKVIHQQQELLKKCEAIIKAMHDELKG